MITDLNSLVKSAVANRAYGRGQVSALAISGDFADGSADI